MLKKRILLIDGHPAIEEGVDSFFGGYPDVSIAATAKSAAEGLELLR
ncbi:MAG: DNA-binding response regulator, partial [Nitrospinaceae bacterium]|nr:DNA-binding response regulator [Nitrospinaceae bacterium]